VRALFRGGGRRKTRISLAVQWNLQRDARRVEWKCDRLNRRGNSDGAHCGRRLLGPGLDVDGGSLGGDVGWVDGHDGWISRERDGEGDGDGDRNGDGDEGERQWFRVIKKVRGVEGVIRRYDVVIDRGLARAQSERNVGLAGGRVTRSESHFRISITFARITARQERKQTELNWGIADLDHGKSGVGSNHCDDAAMVVHGRYMVGLALSKLYTT
jgi:hypothetical protein